MSEISTTVENAPIAAPLVKDQHGSDSETDTNTDTDNELEGIDLVDKVSATIIPVSENVPLKLPNKARTTFDIGTVTIQTANILQRTATVSRDQLNSRTVIKSSSPSSAIANNNASSQKQHKPDAPMLNYIFDSHSTIKHSHYDPRYIHRLVSRRRQLE